MQVILIAHVVPIRKHFLANGHDWAIF